MLAPAPPTIDEEMARFRPPAWLTDMAQILVMSTEELSLTLREAAKARRIPAWQHIRAVGDAHRKAIGGE